MSTLIKNGIIVNENHTSKGFISVGDDGRIASISPHLPASEDTFGKVIDATGCYVIPGVIDEHVHFREPGMTDKATIHSESRAAAYGGVTSYMEMPNTIPPTTTLEAWEDKRKRGRKDSAINYAFYLGATNDNAQTLREADWRHTPAIKLFMGSSTGNMLVDRSEALSDVFHLAAELSIPVVSHCEDTDIINENMRRAKQCYGDDPAIEHHPEIRSEEACVRSTSLAIQLATQAGARLHVAHVSTARELAMIAAHAHEGITAEAVTAHLLFSAADYQTLGTRIKCNPAVKTAHDREALRRALSSGQILTIATDHAPHLPAQKQGGCARAASGMPMVQFSLVSMLGLVDEGCLTIERLVQLMAHQPANYFQLKERGFLRQGYHADIAIVRPNTPWTLTRELIQSPCGWCPVEGRTFNWRVEQTICNGHLVYDRGSFDGNYRGMELEFER